MLKGPRTKWDTQVEVRVPDGTAAIAAVPVAELKFRQGWIARCTRVG